MARLSIGIAQINPTVGDFEGNLKKIQERILEAERRRLDLVVFSEQVVSGYPVWDLANKASFIEANLRSLDTIRALSRKLNVAIIVGFIEKGPTPRRSYNALAVIRRGKIIRKHHKILLPTYDVFLEQIFFESGREQKTFALKGVRIASSICEDLWDDFYPVKPLERAKRDGAELLVNISASPFRSHALLTRHGLLKRKSREYGVAIVYANMVGGQDELIFDGRSLASDSSGNVFFQAPAFSEGLFVFDWAPGDKKRPVPVPDAKRTPDNVYKALVLGLRDYVRKNRFSKVVIGLSGGIDSALVATLAVDALGPEAVLGVALPGPYSSTGSYRDARELARRLGIEFRKVSINPLYKLFKGQKKFPTKIALAEENLQARLRGLELMYLSNKEGRLLLTTGNKSEMAMGYATLYGDMCGGLGVIGDVYKTEVYEIVNYRNKIHPVIPRESIEKAPSAELRPNQKDSDSLPPYAVLDRVLEAYIEENRGLKVIQKRFAGKASARLIERIIRSVDHNEYKRRQAPPVLKVTEKAWFGRRMPITNCFQEV